MMVMDGLIYLDALYNPEDVDYRFYEVVIETYREIGLYKNDIPLLSEVEEVIFRDIMRKIKKHCDEKYQHDHRYYQDVYYKEEIIEDTVREFAEEYKDKVVLDIKKSLRHARLSYIDFDFETEFGNERTVRNSAQVSLFKIYDLKGMSK